MFLLSKTPLPKESYTSIPPTLRVDKWPTQNLNLDLKADAWAAKPFLQHNSLIEGGCWQAFFLSWPPNYCGSLIVLQEALPQEGK